MLQCTEGVRSDLTLTMMLRCAPQVSMGRARGVGMPRPKKKKVAGQEEAGQSCTKLDPAALMPPPSPRPLKAAAAPQRDKDPELQARQAAGKALQAALKIQRKMERKMLAAVNKFIAFSPSHEKMDAESYRLSKQGTAYAMKALILHYEAEIKWLKETALWKNAVFVATEADLKVSNAQNLCKDLQIRRLLRRLKGKGK